jgi:ATP-dependent Clp protease ATP-binding subunit ClpA
MFNNQVPGQQNLQPQPVELAQARLDWQQNMLDQQQNLQQQQILQGHQQNLQQQYQQHYPREQQYLQQQYRLQQQQQQQQAQQQQQQQAPQQQQQQAHQQQQQQQQQQPGRGQAVPQDWGQDARQGPGGPQVRVAPQGNQDHGWHGNQAAPPPPPPGGPVHEDRYRDPWSHDWGLNRFKNFEDVDPPAPPWTIHNVDDRHQVMEHMQEAVQALASPDAAHERMERRNLHMEYWAGPPAWMTLQPPETLVCWAETLKDAVDVDPQAIQHLVELIKYSRLGYQEGTRIIYHLLKDSEHGNWRHGPSSWLVTACNEAMDALRSWRDWEGPYSLSRGGTGVHKGNGKGKDKGPGEGKGSSSSSGAWQQRGYR